MAAAGASQVTIAQKTWEMSNNIMEVRKRQLSCSASLFSKVGAGDEIYKYDRQQQQSLLAAKPWEKDPHFFKVPLLVPFSHGGYNLPFVGHQDFCFGSAEDGDAREVWGQPRDHGAAAGQGLLPSPLARWTRT